MTTVRCFVAVELPAETRQELGELARMLRPSLPDARWVRPDRMHLTLAFLGEVEDDFPARAHPGLEAAGTGHEVFEARLGGIGAFPDPARARVVWVGMQAGSEDLRALQREVVGALVPAGYVPERRPFSPHLTLARLRTPADAGATVRHQFSGREFRVERFVLFRSVLRPGGPDYTELESFGLTSPAA